MFKRKGTDFTHRRAKLQSVAQTQLPENEGPLSIVHT